MFFFFKQKTAYELRISDWSSDVCSSDLEQGLLHLHYQPRVALASETLRGAEALLRWHDAEFGEVSPAQFIPIAEERGLIGPLGDWEIGRASGRERVCQYV